MSLVENIAGEQQKKSLERQVVIDHLITSFSKGDGRQSLLRKLLRTLTQQESRSNLLAILWCLSVLGRLFLRSDPLSEATMMAA